MVKGVAQVIDALAGIAILAIFILGGFSLVEGQNWDNYQNSIAANDLGYSLQRSGLIKDFAKTSDFGDLKSVVDSATGDTLDVSLDEYNLPKKVEIGMHVHQDEIEKLEFSQVDYPDECQSTPTDSIIPGYDESNKPPVVSTEDNSGNLMDRTGIEVYLGQVDRVRSDFGSQLNYNALWIENESQCSFEGPFYPGENFYWGNKTDSNPGGIYQFYMTNTTSQGSNWKGTLEVHEAEYVENISRRLDENIAGSTTYTDLNTFRLTDDFSNKDLLIFRNKSKSIDNISSSQSTRQDLSSYLNKSGNILFQANLNKDLVQNDYNKVFKDLAGFKWFNQDYEKTSSANCNLVSDFNLESNCEYEISFSDNRAGYKTGSIFNDDLSGSRSRITLPINNSVHSKKGGPFNKMKAVYLENYHYKSYKDGVTGSFSSTSSSYPGDSLIDPTTCSDPHTGSMDLFPSETDSDRRVAIIPFGSSCNKYVVGIEDKESRLYADGDKVDINGVTFEIDIVDSQEIIFKSDRISNVGLAKFNYMDSKYPETGLTGYKSDPNNLTDSDYKALATVIYYLSLPQREFQRSNPEETTETIGSINSGGYRPYKIRLRWDW